MLNAPVLFYMCLNFELQVPPYFLDCIFYSILYREKLQCPKWTYESVEIACDQQWYSLSCSGNQIDRPNSFPKGVRK